MGTRGTELKVGIFIFINYKTLFYRKDKDLFLAKHPGVFSSPTVFEARISESLQANPEVRLVIAR